MAETREFVALQRVSRSGKKKLPRRLSLVMVHGGLLESCARTLTLRKKQSRITTGYSIVEKCGKAWRQAHRRAARHERRDRGYTLHGAPGANEIHACRARAPACEDPA